MVTATQGGSESGEVFDQNKIKHLIVCRNKIDITQEQVGLVQQDPYNIVNISALTRAGLVELQQL